MRQADRTLGLNQQPAQRIVFPALVVVTFVAGQVHEAADFLEGQVMGLLVQLFDKFSGLGGTAFGLQLVMDGETHIVFLGLRLRFAGLVLQQIILGADAAMIAEVGGRAEHMFPTD